jgi:protease I
MTGSHSLAAKYMRVPDTLDVIGTDYLLPTFTGADPTWLDGARVLVISADAPELPEIDVPIEYLRARGADVTLAGQDWIFQYRNPAGHIVIAQFLADEICVKADLPMSEVRVPDYDAIFIPGGAWNPDMLRTDVAALKIVREARAQGVLIASLCHGPQVLISANGNAPDHPWVIPAGTHITGVGSIRIDLKNAGFTVHDDDPIVYDEASQVLTARDPKDLGPLCEELGRLLRQRIESRQKQRQPGGAMPDEKEHATI